jgi:hypothetical protein
MVRQSALSVSASTTKESARLIAKLLSPDWASRPTVQHMATNATA